MLIGRSDVDEMDDMDDMDDMDHMDDMDEVGDGDDAYLVEPSDQTEFDIESTGPGPCFPI